MAEKQTKFIFVTGGVVSGLAGHHSRIAGPSAQNAGSEFGRQKLDFADEGRPGAARCGTSGCS